MEKIKLKPEVILIVLILALGLFLRLYRIGDYLTFLGDEGRDVRIVRDLITRGNLVFIGPQTSIGNMYLGPLYYYMMAPALFLSGLNPVGPAVMNALLGTLTIWLTWKLGRQWFGKVAALLAAFLYAISPVAIIYSRSSWNPNPMPFFALLAIWAIYEVWQKKRFSFLYLTAASLAAALQMHYLGLLLIPTLGIFWLLTLKSVWQNKKERSLVIRNSILGVILFLVIMSPLALFDLKHNFQNTNAFKAFFTDRQTTINLNPIRSDRFGLITNQVVTDFVSGKTAFYPLLLGLILSLTFSRLVLSQKNKAAYLLLSAWLFIGLLGLVVYKQHVYDHYYGFLYPAIYLFLGVSIASLLTSRLPVRLFGLALISLLVYFNYLGSPLRETPNRQLARTEAVVDSIIKESDGLPFNFALIAKQNYDESYRYFLENKKAKMVRGEDGLTDQLFVVCEDGDSCHPEGSPVYQVAIFGIAKTVKEWRIDNIRIYRLVHQALPAGRQV